MLICPEVDYHKPMVTKHNNMLSLGTRIKQARECAGFTQEQLAEIIGVTRTAIARYEAGDIEPRIQKLAAIAETLNVSTDYLLDVKGRATDYSIPEKAYFSLMALVEEMKTESMPDFMADKQSGNSTERRQDGKKG